MQQRAIETKKKILEAAVAVFAQKGLTGATVDDIAEAGGVNKQRLYAYYGSKMGLFEAALLHVFQQVELFSRSTVGKAAAHPEKLTEILRNNDIQSVTIVRMEVPCCGGLEMAAKKAIQDSGKFLPWQVVTISIDGEIME